MKPAKKNKAENGSKHSDISRKSIRPKISSRSLKKLQSDFITSTSHQFRTPIATFQSSIDLLEYYIKKGNTTRQQETIEKIKKTLRYLTDTLENLSTLYRHTLSKQKLTPKTINIRKFCNDLLEDVVINISNTHFILINIEQGIDFITCDEFVLKQILLNLIHNAIKFSPKGGQIKLEVSRKGKFLEFVVKDEGIGIEKEDLKKIFNPFIRGKNAMTIPGAGMGLAIVKNLVKMHSAKIECISVVNQGTEFKIKIPQKSRL